MSGSSEEGINKWTALKDSGEKGGLKRDGGLKQQDQQDRKMLLKIFQIKGRQAESGGNLE